MCIAIDQIYADVLGGFCFCVSKSVLLEDAHLLSKDKEDHDPGHN
ncbi:hypothetical protein LINPERPRIM_LOCUS23589 [Linum perenne]